MVGAGPRLGAHSYMTEAVIPTGRSSSWLDRPLVPVWRRLGVIAAQREALAYAGIILVAFILRIWDLGSRALHHDESLHAYYAWQFFVGRGYAYNPLMHGPLKFELTAFFYLLFGVSEFAARLLPAIVGT